MKKFLIFTLLLSLSLILFSRRALADSSGPNSGSGANDASAGDVAWSTPTNIASSDDSYATSAIGSLQTTQYLVATGFGFSIPAGATINGITVEIEKSRTGLGSVNDLAVRIVKGGVIGSTDKSNATAWPTTDAYTTYGSSSDVWGETWTSTDINASNFGVMIRGTNNAARSATARVDHIRITITYTPATASSPVSTSLPLFFD